MNSIRKADPSQEEDFCIRGHLPISSKSFCECSHLRLESRPVFYFPFLFLVHRNCHTRQSKAKQAPVPGTWRRVSPSFCPEKTLGSEKYLLHLASSKFIHTTKFLLPNRGHNEFKSRQLRRGSLLPFLSFRETRSRVRGEGTLCSRFVLVWLRGKRER